MCLIYHIMLYFILNLHNIIFKYFKFKYYTLI